MKVIQRGTVYIDECGNASFSFWTVDWEGEEVNLDKLLQWTIQNKVIKQDGFLNANT